MKIGLVLARRVRMCWPGLMSGMILPFLVAVMVACGDATPTNLPAASVATATPLSKLSVATSAGLPDNTPVSASLLACNASDLSGSAAPWQKQGFSKLIGTISFTNQSSAACILEGVAQIQLTDQTGQLLPFLQEANSARIDTVITIQPQQKAFVVFSINYDCLIPSEPGDGSFILKVSLPGATQAISISVSKFNWLNQPQKCPQPTIEAGPFELVAGASSTATAEVIARTAEVKAKTALGGAGNKGTVLAWTEAARPTPTPAPTPTIIPTLPADAKPCHAKDLKLDFRKGGALGTGLTYGIFLIINTGPTTCTLQGYPELYEVDEKGQLQPDFGYGKIDPKDKFSNFGIPNDANTPVGVRPGKAAALIRESFRCDYSPAPGGRTVYLLLPSNKEKMKLYEATPCPVRPYLAFSPFYYPPDNLITAP